MTTSKRCLLIFSILLTLWAGCKKDEPVGPSINGGTISGVVFNDKNNNGAIDAGEQGLSNWKIHLDGSATDSTITSVNGKFSFTNLPFGFYTVSQEQGSGWIQTLPSSSSGYGITLTSDNAVVKANFGNYSPCSSDTISAYGSGSTIFQASGAGDSFFVAGKYKPSAQFLNDTASMGSGGFFKDTTVGGQPLQGQLVTYFYRLSHRSQLLRLLAFTFEDTGNVSTGIYSWAPQNSHPAGKTVKVTYQFFSDSLVTYDTYEALNGTLTVTALDTCAQHITGSFDGTVWIPPDSATQVHISTGQLDVFYVRKYFAY